MTFYIENITAVNFWAFIGTLYLIIMTWKDLFRNMTIDDRHNFFMMGVSFSLLIYFKISIWYLIGVIIIVIILRKYLNKFKVLGEGDTSALTWLFYGYAIIGYQPLILFTIVFLAFSVIYYLIRVIMKVPDNKPMPFFPVILFTFILTNIVWHLY